MKKPASPSHPAHPEESVTPTPDGHCLTRGSQSLGIALTPASLDRLQSHTAPTHWMLPVDHPSLATRSAHLPGEVLWLCERDPKQVLGPLADDLHGAWIEGDSLVVNLDGHPQHLPLPRPSDGHATLAEIARIAAGLWMKRPSLP